MNAQRTSIIPDIHTVNGLVSYDAMTGLFTWKKQRPQGRIIGSIAGTTTGDGYRRLRINGSPVLAHRAAWLISTGSWPTGVIDHINGIRSDNRLVNLRDVSGGGNHQNQRKPARNNTTGFMGVTRVQGRFQAQITVGHRNRYIGRFDTPSEAHSAYLSTKRKLHATCTI